MNELRQILKRLKDAKPYLQAKYGVKDLAVFGSYARKEQQPQSDVDILVTFERPIGIEFIDLALELENLLGRKVDLVSKGGVKPRYMAVIEKDLEYA